MLEMAKGYGALVDVLGGPQSFLQFKMLESRTYEGLAEANARAVNGLQPKITTWNTGKCPLSSNPRCIFLTSRMMIGNGDATGDSGASPMRNIMQNLPPLLSTIHEQTGIAPPSWIAQMPGESHLSGVQLTKAPDANGVSAHEE